MIYAISDIEGDIDNLLEKCRDLTEDDYVIVAGDFGFFAETQDKLLEKNIPFKLLFLDGNHEDFRLLNGYAVTEYCGGKARQIMDNVYHLLRGQVFELKTEKELIKIAVLGGGESRDKEYRQENVDWFSEESVTDDDVEELNRNLQKHDYQVDYFFSHVPSAELKIFLYNSAYRACIEKNGGNFSDLERKRLERLRYGDSEYRVYTAIEGEERPPLKAKAYYCGHEHHFFGEYEIKGKKYYILSNNLQKVR